MLLCISIAILLVSLYVVYKLCRFLIMVIVGIYDHIRECIEQYEYQKKKNKKKQQRLNRESSDIEAIKPEIKLPQNHPIKVVTKEVTIDTKESEKSTKPADIKVSFPYNEQVLEYCRAENGKKILHSEAILESFSFFKYPKRPIFYRIEDKDQNLVPHPSDGREFSDELVRQAHNGDISAQYALALCRFDSSSEHYNFAEFLYWMDNVARSCSFEYSKWGLYANLFFAECYRDGKYGFPICYQDAFTYYENTYKNEAEDYIKSCYALCRMYGIGTRSKANQSHWLKPCDDENFGDTVFFFREYIKSIERLSNRNDIQPNIKDCCNREIAERRQIYTRYLKDREEHFKSRQELRDVNERYRQKDPLAAIWLAKRELDIDNETSLEYFNIARQWGADVDYEIKRLEQIIKHRAYLCRAKFLVKVKDKYMRDQTSMLITQEELDSIVKDRNKSLLNNLVTKNCAPTYSNQSYVVEDSYLEKYEKEKDMIITNPEEMLFEDRLRRHKNYRTILREIWSREH